MSELLNSLHAIARSKSVPFCYACYCKATSGRCSKCRSDDLMLEYPGHGTDWGTDWIVREILSEYLTPADTLEAFEQSVSDCYPESATIGWLRVDTATALKQLDSVSWNLAHSEWVDNEVTDQNLTTFDNGSTYYWTRDIEQFIAEAVQF